MMFRYVFQSSYHTGPPARLPLSSPSTAIAGPRGKSAADRFARPSSRKLSDPSSRADSAADTGRNLRPCRGRAGGSTDGIAVRRCFYRTNQNETNFWLSAQRRIDERRRPKLLRLSYQRTYTHVPRRPAFETRQKRWTERATKRDRRGRNAQLQVRTANASRRHRCCSVWQRFQLLDWRRPSVELVA